MNDKLTKLFDELLIGKTFSLDAINAIQSLKTEVQQLQIENKEQFERLQRKTAEELRLVEQLEASKSDVSRLKALLETSQKEAQALRDLGQQGKEAKAELKGFTEAMAMVFKPSSVRETIHKRVPVPVEGNPGGSGSFGSAGFVVESNETGTIDRSHE